MSNEVYTQQKFSKLEETDRIVVAAIGGAVLGGSIFGAPGAIIIGLIGAVIGRARNEEIRKIHQEKK